MDYSPYLNESNIDIGNATIDNLTITGIPTNGVVITGSDGELDSIKLNKGQILLGRTGQAPAPGNIVGTENQVIVDTSEQNIHLSLPQDIHTDADVEFKSVTTDKLKVSDIGSGVLVSEEGDIVAKKMVGTENQVIVDTSEQNIHLSLPQDIHPTSNVKFKKVIATDTVESELFSGENFFSPHWSPGSILVANNNKRITSAEVDTDNGLSIDITGDSVSMTLAQDIRPTASPTFQGLTLDSTKLEAKGSHTYTFPDVGQDSEFVMTNGVQEIHGHKKFTDTAIRIGDLILRSSGGGQHEYKVPNVGYSAEFVMTNGVQEIHGHKKFTDTAIRIGDLILRSSGGGQHEYKVPNVGYSADFVMTQGNQDINGFKRFLSNNGLNIQNSTDSSYGGALWFGGTNTGYKYHISDSEYDTHFLDTILRGHHITRAFTHHGAGTQRFEIYGKLEAKQDVDVGGTLTANTAVIRSGENDKGILRLGTAESGIFYDTPESGGSWHILDQKIHGKTIARAFAFDNDEDPGRFEVKGKLVAEKDFEVRQKSEFKDDVKVNGNLEVGGNITTQGIYLPGSSLLNYYEEKWYFTTGWTAMVGLVTNATRNCEIYFTKVGSVVTLFCLGVDRFDCQLSAPNGNYIFASLPIPSRFRPLHTVNHLIPVTINDTRTIGLCYISEYGAFEIHPGPTRDAASTRFAGPDNGFLTFSVSYISAE